MTAEAARALASERSLCTFALEELGKIRFLGTDSWGSCVRIHIYIHNRHI